MKTTTKWISFILVLALSLGICGCQKEKQEELLSGKIRAEIVVQNYGTIQLVLDADVAPITVTNFVKLAKSGFYDGLTFHRIIQNFMIQGGDPNGDGSGGSDTAIIGEFSENGHPNSISHTRGTISMARQAALPNSAKSQFFIVVADSTHLDGSYAAFGTVTSGMEIVDALSTIPSDATTGLVATVNQPTITSIRIIT